MRTLLRITILLTLTATIPVNTIFGQIYSNSADAVKDISYKSYTGNDKLFAFYQTNGSYRPGELSADGPGAGTFDFTWTKYDEIAHTFSIPVQSDAGQNSSTIGDLNEGGYRVNISNGVDVDTNMTAWVMLDILKVWNLKDVLGNIPDYRSNCSEGNLLSLTGYVKVDSFYYYDPVTFDSIFFENDFNIEWTCDDADHFIPNSTNKNAMALNTDYNPPIEDTWYILSATDSLGMTEIDSVFFDSPFTEAKFSVEYYDKINMTWSADLSSDFSLTSGSLDAPLTVRFTNESIGGSLYHWFLLDTTNTLSGESNQVKETTENFDFQPEFTYETADETFNPYLVSVNVEQGNCKDTFKLETGITVVPSQLIIPNVFSPDGNSINDFFIFKHQSIKSFKITIISRHGMKVFNKTVNNIYDEEEWTGWDGKIMNTNRDAPEGQYYYIINATGYDNVDYHDLTLWEQKKLELEQGGGTGTTATDPDDETGVTTQYTGWLYLFRESNL